jgi:hypothetical protein
MLVDLPSAPVPRPTLMRLVDNGQKKGGTNAAQV